MRSDAQITHNPSVAAMLSAPDEGNVRQNFHISSSINQNNQRKCAITSEYSKPHLCYFSLYLRKRAFELHFLSFYNKANYVVLS